MNMKPTLPTVGLLDRLPNGKPARSYTPSHMTNLRETFARLEQERQRMAFENVTQLKQR